MTELIKYEDACRALAECARVDEVNHILNDADKLAACAKILGNTQMLADAKRIMWRAKNRMGELLKQMEKAGGGAYGGKARIDGSRKVPSNPPPKLSDLGITKKLSSEAQRVASVPDKLREKALASEDPDKSMKECLANLRKPVTAKPGPSAGTEKVASLMDAGLSTQEIAAEVGIGTRRVNAIVREEMVRREAEAQIDPATLSLTAQQKLESAIRQHKRQLEMDFDRRVGDEIRQRINEIVLPSFNKQRAEAELVIKSRKGVMPRSLFRKILACLHPDQGMGKAAMTEAFHAFEKLELALCSEKEMPTPTIAFPTNYSELMELRRKTTAARKAKRSGNGSVAYK
jgi:hypothetical protein